MEGIIIPGVLLQFPQMFLPKFHYLSYSYFRADDGKFVGLIRYNYSSRIYFKKICEFLKVSNFFELIDPIITEKSLLLVSLAFAMN